MEELSSRLADDRLLGVIVNPERTPEQELWLLSELCTIRAQLKKKLEEEQNDTFLVPDLPESRIRREMNIIQNISGLFRDAHFIFATNAELTRSEIDDVFVPPSSIQIDYSEEDKREKSPFLREWNPVYHLIMHTLRELNMNMKDCKWYSGQNTLDSFRDDPYELLIIPDIQKMILFCPESGNKTFVIHTAENPEFFYSKNKNELKESEYVTDLDWSENIYEWIEELKVHLMEIENVEIIKTTALDEHTEDSQSDIDVSSWGEKEWRQAFIEKYPDPKFILQKGHKVMREIDVCGKKICALSKIFGVHDYFNHQNMYYFLQILQRIYGESEPFIKKAYRKEQEIFDKREKMKMTWENLTIIDLKDEIIKRHSASKSFISMSTEERLSFSIFGKKLNGIGALFGIFDNPVEIKRSFVLLAQEIYGSEDPYIQKTLEKLSKSEEMAKYYESLWLTLNESDWRNEIKKHYPSVQNFLKIKSVEKNNLEIFGKKISALFTVFNIENRLTKLNFLYFAQKIYQEDFEIIQDLIEEQKEVEIKNAEMKKRKVETKDWTLNDWKNAFKQKYPNVQDLLKQSTDRFRYISVKWKKVAALSSLFGITGNPYTKKNILQFLLEMYGHDNEDIQQALEKLSSD